MLRTIPRVLPPTLRNINHSQLDRNSGTDSYRVVLRTRSALSLQDVLGAKRSVSCSSLIHYRCEARQVKMHLLPHCSPGASGQTCCCAEAAGGDQHEFELVGDLLNDRAEGAVLRPRSCDRRGQLPTLRAFSRAVGYALRDWEPTVSALFPQKESSCVPELS